MIRLPADLADRYRALLRPWGTILSAAGPGDEPAGVLGGEPHLPEDLDWPVWDGHGPLSFVASLDCGRLGAEDLPADGTLLFFYFDGQIRRSGGYLWGWVHPDAPGSGPGSRVLYVPAGTPLSPGRAPDPLKPYKRVPLRPVRMAGPRRRTAGAGLRGAAR